MDEQSEGKGLNRWQDLRMEVRLLCYDVAIALEHGRGLDNIRTRSLPEDIESARQELFRVLGKGWSSYALASNGGTFKYAMFYNILYKTCKKYFDSNAAWCAILELCGGGSAELFIRPRQSLGPGNAWDGVGALFIRLWPEGINRVIDALTPKISPKWIRCEKALMHEKLICKTYDRFASKQFAILDAFEKAGWPKAIDVPGIMSRQTALQLNDRMDPASPIRFGFSEKGNSVSWSLGRADNHLALMGQAV